MSRLARGATILALVFSSALRAEAAPPPGELYQTVATKTSRKQLSELLVAPAQQAAKARDWAKAIPLYQALVVARGAGSPEGKQLATLWTLAGQNEDAAEAWRAYAAAVSDERERADALAEAQRLGAAPDPFADKLQTAQLTAEARQVSDRLRREAVRRRPRLLPHGVCARTGPTRLPSRARIDVR